VGNPDEDFEDFFRADLPQLVRILVHAGWGWEDARDAASEAMLSVYQGWAEIDHPRAYVRKVAFRVAAEHRRRDRQRTLRSILGGHATPEQTDPYALLDERMDASRRLKALLRKVPDQQRLVLLWSLDGFTNTEIAVHLDMRPGTVASNLRHARDCVRRLLQPSALPAPKPLPTAVIPEGGARHDLR
jgi:RNA polymerase sigma-70 factor (ECF subfamily)